MDAVFRVILTVMRECIGEALNNRILTTFT